MLVFVLSIFLFFCLLFCIYHQTSLEMSLAGTADRQPSRERGQIKVLFFFVFLAADNTRDAVGASVMSWQSGVHPTWPCGGVDELFCPSERCVPCTMCARDILVGVVVASRPGISSGGVLTRGCKCNLQQRVP